MILNSEEEDHQKTYAKMFVRPLSGMHQMTTNKRKHQLCIIRLDLIIWVKQRRKDSIKSLKFKWKEAPLNGRQCTEISSENSQIHQDAS